MKELLYLGAALALLPLASGSWDGVGDLAAVWSSLSQQGAALVGGEPPRLCSAPPALPLTQGHRFQGNVLSTSRLARAWQVSLALAVCTRHPWALLLSTRSPPGRRNLWRAWRTRRVQIPLLSGLPPRTRVWRRRCLRWAAATYAAFADEFRSLLRSALAPAVVRNRADPGVGFAYIR